MNAFVASRGALTVVLGLITAGCGGESAGSASTTSGGGASTSTGSGGATTTSLGGAGGSGGAGGVSAGGRGGAGGATTSSTGGGGAGGATPTPVVHALAGVVVSTLAGSAQPGDADGAGVAARFENPVNVARAADGSLVVAEFDGGRLRRIEGDAVTTLTEVAGFARPFGVAFGPGGELYVETDENPVGQHQDVNGTIWRIDPATGDATVILADCGWPRGLAVRGDGRLVLADRLTHTLQVLDPETGQVTMLAGKAGSPGFADGQGTAARFEDPYGIALDAAGNVVVADKMNHRLRRVTPAGVVTTIAGTGGAGMVDGPAAEAWFAWPQDVAIDAAGDIFVSDRGNQRIRRVGTDGEVVTVAGDGTPGFLDGAGDVARFFGQEGLDVSPDGKTLVVADGNGGDAGPYHRVRKIEVP